MNVLSCGIVQRSFRQYLRAVPRFIQCFINVCLIKDEKLANRWKFGISPTYGTVLAPETAWPTCRRAFRNAPSNTNWDHFITFSETRTVVKHWQALVFYNPRYTAYKSANTFLRYCKYENRFLSVVVVPRTHLSPQNRFKVLLTLRPCLLDSIPCLHWVSKRRLMHLSIRASWRQTLCKGLELRSYDCEIHGA